MEAVIAAAGDELELGRQIDDILEKSRVVIPVGRAPTLGELAWLEQGAEQPRRRVEGIDQVIVRKTANAVEVEVAVIEPANQRVGHAEQRALVRGAALIADEVLLVK